MIDLDAPAPCGCCGAPLTWEVRDSDADDDEPPYYTATCGCGMEWEYAMAGMSWRDVSEYAWVNHDGAYAHYLRELVAEVERLTREVSRRDAAVATAVMEEREAVVRFFRGRMADRRRKGHTSEFHRGAYSALDASIHMIECGAHRREDA